MKKDGSMGIEDVQFLDKDGRVYLIGTVEYFASEEGQILEKAIREINQLRQENG